MRTVRNWAALLFLVSLILSVDSMPRAQFRTCTAAFRECANGTCEAPILPGGIPTCETLCRSMCCSGFSGLEPTIGCGNPGADCEGNLYNQLVVFKSCGCAGACRRDDDYDYYSPDDEYPYYDCDDNDAGINPGIVPSCDSGLGQDFNCDGIDDLSQCQSPVIVDVEGDGFSLTNATNGVLFDLNGDGVQEVLSWTAPGSDDAWLVLDRNQNGLIDDGGELFGNFTQQPPSNDPNGFLALAIFDRPDAGGNADGWIGLADFVFPRLRLWCDENHDGMSQPNELRSLGEAGVSRLSTEYRLSKRSDEWGNVFRYRAKVRDRNGSDAGRWAYDVYLVAPAVRQAP